MKSITIHNIETELANKIEELATKHGLSLNKTIKQILRERLISENEIDRNRFNDLFGTWTKKESEEFDENIKIFEQIDDDIWK